MDSIEPVTKHATKKVDEVAKAGKLFGINFKKRSDNNGRKNERIFRRSKKDA